MGAPGAGGQEFGEDGATLLMVGLEGGAEGEAGEVVEQPGGQEAGGAEGVDVLPMAQGDLGGKVDGAAGGEVEEFAVDGADEGTKGFDLGDELGLAKPMGFEDGGVGEEFEVGEGGRGASGEEGDGGLGMEEVELGGESGIWGVGVVEEGEDGSGGRRREAGLGGEKGRELGGGVVEGEVVLDALEAVAAEASAEVGILGQRGKVRGEGGGVGGGSEKAGVAVQDHFGDAGQGGGDDGEAAGHGFEDDRGEDIGGTFGVGEGGEDEGVGGGECLLDLFLAEGAAEADVAAELEAVDMGFESGALGALADDLELDGEALLDEGGDGFEEDGEAFEVDEAADADEAEGFGGGGGGLGAGELSGVDAVVDAVNAGRGVGADLEEEVAAVVADGGGEGRGAHHFAEEVVVAEIDHEVLGVGGEAEGEADLVQEECGVGGAVGEMDVEMGDVAALEFAGEMPGVAGADEGFEGGAVALEVLAGEVGHGEPKRVVGRGLEGVGRGRVDDFGAELGEAFVAEAIRRRIEAADDEGDAGSLKGQHFGVAKSLRDDGEAREEVGEAHGEAAARGRRDGGGRSLWWSAARRTSGGRCRRRGCWCRDGGRRWS